MTLDTGSVWSGSTPLVDVVEGLRRGRLSSRDLVRDALEAPDAHAAVERRLPDSLAQAAAADRRRRSGTPLGPLDGVPFAVKANLDVAGVPTTNGTGLAHAPAVADAAIVAALRAAGAVPCLTTTMAEAALGAVTANPHTGTCRNPRDEDRHAGGSSGGAAAVVAAGTVSLSLGSDTMGSVRIPAAYCGVAAWKPARGEFSTRGLTPLSRALDSIGVLVPRAGDLSVVLSALAVDSRQSPPRVGVSRDPDLEPDQRDALAAAVEALARRGIPVHDLPPAPFRPAVVRRRGLLLCEVEGYLTHRTAVDSADPGLSPGLAALLRYGRDADGGRVCGAVRELAAVVCDIREWMGPVDALLLPVTRGPAPPVGQDPSDAADLTAWVNVAGLASVVTPLRPMLAGLRPAVQFVGRLGWAHRLIELACLVEDAGTTAEVGRTPQISRTPQAAPGETP